MIIIKKYMKIKFNSDDDLPLNKTLKSHNIAIIVRTIFHEDNKKRAYVKVVTVKLNGSISWLNMMTY